METYGHKGLLSKILFNVKRAGYPMMGIPIGRVDLHEEEQ